MCHYSYVGHLFVSYLNGNIHVLQYKLSPSELIEFTGATVTTLCLSKLSS